MTARLRPILAVLAIALIVGGCATLMPGDDPVVVKAEDVLANSLTLYEQTMTLHYAKSTEESPELYKAAETVRVVFPPAWRGLNTTKEVYRLAKTKDPEQLRAAVLIFLDELERDGPPKWKAAIRLIRATFTAGGA